MAHSGRDARDHVCATARLEKAIAKATKEAAEVKQPAKELLALLAAVTTGKAPAATKTDADAKTELDAMGGPGKVEDVIDSALNQRLHWAMDPSSMGK